jgi:hypothetical protein
MTVLTAQELDDAIERCKISWFHYVLLVICGLNFMVDSMEISLLPYLVNCVGVEWNLTTEQKASIGGAVYAGCVVGCFIWGAIGDKFGRRWTYLAAASLIAIAGFASAAATSFTSLLLIRVIVGFGIGGAHVPFDLLAEFTPQRFHNTFLTSVEYFYTIGSVFVSTLAWLLLEQYGWRCLTALTAVPILVATLFSIFFLPESPRWLLVKGRMEEASQVVRTSLKSSFSSIRTEEEDFVEECSQPLEESNSVIHKPATCHDHNYPDLGGGKEKDGSVHGYIQRLYADGELRTRTMLLWSIWFSFGVTYYGIVLYIANIYSYSSENRGTGNEAQCSFDYSSIILNALSEFFGTTIAVAGAARWNHIRAQLGFYVVAGVSAVFLGLMHSVAKASMTHDSSDSSPMSVTILLLSFLARISIMSASTLTWTMTPPMIPTQYRSFGHALCVALSKIGAIVSPYLIYLSAGSSGALPDLVVSGVIAFLNFWAALALYYLSAASVIAVKSSDEPTSSNEYEKSSSDSDVEDSSSLNILHAEISRHPHRDTSLHASPHHRSEFEMVQKRHVAHHSAL